LLTDDIRLAREFFDEVLQHPALQAFTLSLSVATFRYVPPDLRDSAEKVEDYLELLNRELLIRIQSSGEAYLSNAVIDGKFLLRACIVNFRTSSADVMVLVPLVVRFGQELDAALRAEHLARK